MGTVGAADLKVAIVPRVAAGRDDVHRGSASSWRRFDVNAARAGTRIGQLVPKRPTSPPQGGGADDVDSHDSVLFRIRHEGTHVAPIADSFDIPGSWYAEF